MSSDSTQCARVRSLADREGLPTLAVIKGHATHSQEPQWFTKLCEL
jgi:hypothetical protein